MRIGIIGATGWLGSALGSRLLSQGIVDADRLLLANRSGPRADYQGHVVAWARDAQDLADRCDAIVLSVRPQDWPALTLQAPGRLVLSFMAGVPASALARTGGRIVRAMPNAAAEVGRSYSPWWAAAEVGEADRRAVRQILSAIGEDEIAMESQLDLMTALPGSGPAYAALMATAMAGYMLDRGVPHAIAWRAAQAAVCDGAALLQDRIEASPDMVRAYRDYRGTTAAGIEAAEAAGFSAAVRAALDAATLAARRLSAAAAAEPALPSAASSAAIGAAGNPPAAALFHHTS